jgi:hypothetical protein
MGKLEPELGEGNAQPLAGPATLSRLENSHPGLAGSDRYRRISLDQGAVDRLLVDSMPALCTKTSTAHVATW